MSLTSPSARPARRTFAPAVCGLEDRQLMAGSIFFSGGTLNFYADQGASQAALTASTTAPGSVVATIDGQTQQFTAAEVKLVMFYGSDDGQDSFVNNTNETSVSFLSGTRNSVVGGLGTDIVVDYSTDGSAVDSNGGALTYIDANDGQPHNVSFRITRSGGLIIKAY